MNDDLLLVGDVARQLSVSVRTVWRWIREGRLPRPIYIAGKPRWRQGEVEAHIRSLVYGTSDAKQEI